VLDIFFTPPPTLLASLPGNVAQGVIWVSWPWAWSITFRLLDYPYLTVDGSFAAGAP
jgi:putative ABC transport system permease protein